MNRTSDDPPSQPLASARGPWWRLPALLGIVLVAILLWRGRGDDRQPPLPPRDEPHPLADSADATGETVSLSFEFAADEIREFDGIPWRQGMTVADLMNVASRREGGLEFEHQGIGGMAFLSRIDQQANEGAGKRNWLYQVNGQHADRSFAIYELQPGDRVLWRFTTPK